MLTAAMSMIPRIARTTPMLARSAVPMAARVSLAATARVPVAMPTLLARGYASGGGPSLDEIKSRITDVIKSFEKVDPNMWVGANRKFRKVPRDRVERARRSKSRTADERAEVNRKLMQREKKRRAKLARAGMDYEFPGYQL